MSSIAIGCSVAVISSFIQSLGITLQRKSHVLNHNPIQVDHIHTKRNMWLTGFLLFIVANVLGSLIQITTLPLIILSPLQSIGLIFNSVLSCLLLPNEAAFTVRLAAGTAVIALGAFIIAYNGTTEQESPGNDASERLAEILHKLTRPAFLSWFILTFVFIGMLLLAVYVSSRNRKTNRTKFTKGILYGIISGTLTAHTFLFAKSLIDTIVQTIMSHHHDLALISANTVAYLLLFMMFTIIACQLTAFNLALAQVLNAVLYPLCFLVYNLVNLINDVVFNLLLAENKMTVVQFFYVLLGLVGVLVGVVLISWDSAVPTRKRIYLESEDELLLFSKFPYNKSNLLVSAHKRVLSYEQTQILSLVDP